VANFFEGFADKAARSEIDRLDVYGVKTVRRMLKAMGATDAERKAIEYNLGPEYAIADFCEQMAFPVLLIPCKVEPFPFHRLATAFIKTPVYDSLSDVISSLGSATRVGIVFSAWRKHWVAHTYWEVVEVPGHSQMRRCGKTEGIGMVVELVDGFAKAVRTAWSYE